MRTTDREYGFDFFRFRGAIFGCFWLVVGAGWCGDMRAGDFSVALPEHHPYRILVQPKPTVGAEALIKLQGSREAKMLNASPVAAGLQLVAVAPGESVQAAIERCRQSGLVEFAEPDYVRHLTLTPNDPKYMDGTLWGLNNFGQAGGTPDADIDAPEAWDILTSASGVVVAVLDTGIRPTHEDLAANIWTNTALGGYGWNALAGTTAPADDEGHGSLVSGVLGAVGNNGKGVAGVGSRPEIGWYFGKKDPSAMKVIRYSDAFKMQVVREVEAGDHTAFGARRKYNIKGAATVTRWVRQLGSGKYGKIIRVERPEEINETARLRTQLRQAKEALADAYMELALEKAFLGVACEQLDQTVEGFKKKHGGTPRTKRSSSTRS